MKISARWFLPLIFSSLLVTSCGDTTVTTYVDKLEFKQETLTLGVGETFNVSTLLSTSIDLSKVEFSVSNEDILSLVGVDITATKVGETIVEAKYEDLSTSLNVNIVNARPNISYTETSFTLNLDEEDTFDVSTYIDVTPSDASINIKSTAIGGYEISGTTIKFTSSGQYVFTVNAEKDGMISSGYTFDIDVYQSFNLHGEGTLENPFLVSTAKDLKELSDAVLNYKDLKDAYFLQTNDISLKEYDNWIPIGTFGIPFEGIYDGDNYEVTDLKINTTSSWQGLFGFSSGVIKNLSVRGDVYVYCNPDFVYSHSFAGGVVGGLYNNALVSNCINYANVHGDSYVGGICGGIARSDEMITYRDQSYIINCENYGEITGDDTYAYNENAMYFGGICGESLGILSNNTNYGKVTVTGEKTQYIGGVCGLSYLTYKYGMYLDEDLEIYASNDNTNYGEVSGYHSVGGVFGANATPSSRCYNHAKVSGDVCVAGISGLAGTNSVYENNYSNAPLTDCINYGDIYLNDRYAGGITSCSYYDIKQCTNDGNVIGGPNAYYVGGVVGYQSGGGNIIDCVNNEGYVTGYYGLGGIAGWSKQNSLIISNCENNADVYCVNGSDVNAVHIGGVVGMLGTSNEVRYCVNNGDVVGMGTRDNPERWGGTGGVAGSMYSASKIINSDNNGKVTGQEQIGGIVGFISGSYASIVSGCTNGETGIIKSTSLTAYLGCIVGRANYSSIIDNKNYGHYVVLSEAQYYDYIVGSNSGAGLYNNINYYEE